ncbi:MAG: hypothetical protein HY760_00480 [Nitrospirae bacterium]|nr:hypothetical protein [Nitrospirota bacterium]
MDLERASSDAHFHFLIRTLGRLGARAALATEYVDGFRTKKSAALSAKKLRRLLEEVEALLKTGTFTYDNREYKTTPEAIEEALREVCNRDLLGLKNHNYLKQVIRGVIEKRRAQYEKSLRSPYRDPKRDNAPEITVPEEPPSMEEIRGFTETLGKIGKEMP